MANQCTKFEISSLSRLTTQAPTRSTWEPNTLHTTLLKHVVTVSERLSCWVEWHWQCARCSSRSRAWQFARRQHANSWWPRQQRLSNEQIAPPPPHQLHLHDRRYNNIHRLQRTRSSRPSTDAGTGAATGGSGRGGSKEGSVRGSMAPQAEIWPPNEIFVECIWTFVVKTEWLCVGFMSKTAYFSVRLRFGDAESSHWPPRWRC